MTCPTSCQQDAIERFNLFQSNPRIRALEGRLENWTLSGQGTLTNLRLSALCASYIEGSISLSEFKDQATKAGAEGGLTRAESEFCARSMFEIARLSLAGSREIGPLEIPDVEPSWGIE